MHRGLFWLTLAAVWLSASAHAQLSKAKGPLDIRSERGSVRVSECRMEYSGNVEVLQDSARLRSDALDRYSAKQTSKGSPGASGCGDTVRLEARGHVYYVYGERRVRADHAVYIASDETLTITGNVVLVQGKDVQRCTRVVVNTRTGDAIFDGEPVRAVLYPKADED